MQDLQIIDQRDVLGKDFVVYGDFENPLFLAKDVAKWIEHSNSRMMLQSVDENEKICVNNPYASSGQQEHWFLTEDGLYEILMQSRKPIAKTFKKMVKEILKEIRKHGEYKVPLQQLTPIEIMRIQLGMLDNHGDRLDKLETTMNIDYEQKKRLKALANKVVVIALGGKDARAYRYKADDGKKISSCVFSRFWRDFNDYFQLNSYENLPRVKFDEAIDYINKWHSPTNMRLEIQSVNNGEE